MQVEKATQKLQALQTKAEEQMDAKDYYGAVTTIAKALSARAFLVSNQLQTFAPSRRLTASVNHPVMMMTSLSLALRLCVAC
eukprot:COSAG04_NODE_977_length_9041_cov_4.994520_9_plen_82_part_00